VGGCCAVVGTQQVVLFSYLHHGQPVWWSTFKTRSAATLEYYGYGCSACALDGTRPLARCCPRSLQVGGSNAQVGAPLEEFPVCGRAACACVQYRHIAAAAFSALFCAAGVSLPAVLI